MDRFIEGKTEKCIVAHCGKEAIHWDGIVLKSRDAVSAGFCDFHWFITQCPNSFGIKGCFGVYSKDLGIKKDYLKV